MRFQPSRDCFKGSAIGEILLSMMPAVNHNERHDGGKHNLTGVPWSIRAFM
jgi:hypothetical protein